MESCCEGVSLLLGCIPVSIFMYTPASLVLSSPLFLSPSLSPLSLFLSFCSLSHTHTTQIFKLNLKLFNMLLIMLIQSVLILIEGADACCEQSMQ